MTRAWLARGIGAEARRLNQFVDNLMDVIRLESHTLQLNLVPTDLDDFVAAAFDRCSPLLGDRSVELDIPANFPLINADDVMFEHVTVARRSPSTRIRTNSRSRPRRAVLS